MSKSNVPDPTIGDGVPPKPRGRVAGFFATLAVDFLVWISFLIVAMIGDLSGPALVAVGMSFGYLIVGVILYYYGRDRGYTEFNQGVIIATSIVCLLSVACWGSLGRM
jgi:hypothetical protein